jgi:hypothetical protein
MRVLPFLVMLLTSAPAWAAGSAIPEPSTSALFALGVIGVVVGRHASRRRRRD